MVFLIAGGIGMLLLWALMSALSGSRQTTRPPTRDREPGRCRRADCNHLNNPQARFCGNCGRSLA